MESALFLKTPGRMAFHSSSVNSVLSATSVLVPMLFNFQVSTVDFQNGHQSRTIPFSLEAPFQA
jgi:hypothetical protein